MKTQADSKRVDSVGTKYSDLPEDEKQKRAYCKDCTHFADSREVDGSCMHHDNLYIEYTWYKYKVLNHRKPSDINKDNDCGWYEFGGTLEEFESLIDGEGYKR